MIFSGHCPPLLLFLLFCAAAPVAEDLGHEDKAETGRQYVQQSSQEASSVLRTKFGKMPVSKAHEDNNTVEWCEICSYAAVFMLVCRSDCIPAERQRRHSEMQPTPVTQTEWTADPCGRYCS